jgi:hypothetical protein
MTRNCLSQFSFMTCAALIFEVSGAFSQLKARHFQEKTQV